MLNTTSIGDGWDAAHPHMHARLSPAAPAAERPPSRAGERRRRGHARRELLAEAIALLFGMAAFSAVTWMLAAIVR